MDFEQTLRWFKNKWMTTSYEKLKQEQKEKVKDDVFYSERHLRDKMSLDEKIQKIIDDMPAVLD